MIDIHSHILPGMDDGARSFEEALEMAYLAAESGTALIAATIHANMPGMETKGRRELYLRQLGTFCSLLKREGIPLAVASGMEVFADGSFPEALNNGEFLTLNGTPYLLVEFSIDECAAEIYRVLGGILQRGYIPVLAHPERYECVRRVPAHVCEWDRMGAVIQLNKGSLLGRFGRTVRKTAESLLRHRLVHAVASDAHRADIRTTDLSEVSKLLCLDYGASAARLFLEENPSRILSGRAVVRGRTREYDYSEHL